MLAGAAADVQHTSDQAAAIVEKDIHSDFAVGIRVVLSPFSF